MIRLGGLISRRIFGISEDKDDKYTHIGYGHYKLKGKEKDDNATVFSKEGNRYVPTKKTDVKSKGSTTKEPEKPKVNIFDKPDTKQTSIKFGKERPDIPKKPTMPKKDDLFNFVADRISDKERKKIRKDWNTQYKTGEKDWDKYLYNNVKDIKPSKTDDTKIQSTKIKDLMPKANADTFSGKSDISKISPKQKKQISMKIDQLDKIAKEAKAKGVDAPNYNLCQITVPGTNLYCDHNLGIPREEMPQFKGKPQPNTPASKMKLDKNGEVDSEPVFKQMLKKNGIKTAETEIPADALKATQSELIGTKVAGMTKALEQNPNDPGITAPIYVSRDGYVIDGHHRWAAMTSLAIAKGKPTNMKVVVIDDDAKNIIPMANKFAQDIGVASKKTDNGDSAEKQLSLSDERAKLVKQQDRLAGGTASSSSVKKKLAINNKRIKDIDAELKKSEPTKDSTKSRAGHPETNKKTRKLAQKLGITPQKLGKDKYKKVMAQAAVSALIDTNYSDEARELVAKLEGKPELAQNPIEMDDYKRVSDKGYKEWRSTTAWGSEYYNAPTEIDEFGRSVAKFGDWNADESVDAIAFDLKMNGFKELAKTIQDIFEGKTIKKSTSLVKMIKEALGHPDFEIAHYTGTRNSAVAEFIKKHNIDGDKLASYVRKGKMPERMKFVSALVGKPNNKSQQEIIKKFGNK